MNCPHNCHASHASKDTCAFTSLLLLGGLFAVSASPCRTLPVFSLLVIAGVPLITFAVAAPSRLGLRRESGLFVRGLEALLLGGLLFVIGKRQASRAVFLRQRLRVESAYGQSGGPFARAVGRDPSRLHHARRLAFFATLWLVVAGLTLPLTNGNYTFGPFPYAPFVFALDALVLMAVGRLVSERIALRLLEATHSMRAAGATRIRMLPISVMLGTALGAVGALLVGGAMGLASAVETAWMPGMSTYPTILYVGTFALMALVPGILLGAVLGSGLSMAESPVALLKGRKRR
jgi:hypothetical protein